jgi:hypothetical protein
MDPSAKVLDENNRELYSFFFERLSDRIWVPTVAPLDAVILAHTAAQDRALPRMFLVLAW